MFLRFVLLLFSGLALAQQKAQMPRLYPEDHRPPLFLRETWKDPGVQEILVTGEHLTNPNLEIKLYGPGNVDVRIVHHQAPKDDPTYIWSGSAPANWALTNVRMPERGERMKMRFTTIALGLALCTGFGFAANTVTIRGGDNVASGFDHTSSDTLAGLTDSSGSGGFCCNGTSQYSATAAGGYSNGSIVGTHSGFGNSTRILVETRFTADFVLKSLTNQAVPVSLNLVLLGSTDGGTCPGDTFRVDVSENNIGAGAVSLTNSSGLINIGQFLVPPPTRAATPFTTSSATLSTNTMQILDLTFTVSVSSNGPGCTISGAGTLTFPTNGPVFSLPADVTVDVPALNIFNNRWRDPRVGVSPVSLNFGTLNIGTTQTQIVTLTNQQTLQNVPLLVQSISFDAPANGFSDPTPPSSFPVSIPPGGTLDVPVKFGPPASGPFSNTLHIGTSSSNVDVPVAGTGAASAPPPGQQITDILNFFDNAANLGALTGSGAGNSAAGRLHALRNMIDAAGDLIQQGKLADACTQLKDALNRTDGNPKPPDFVAGPAAPQLMQMLQSARTAIGCM